MTIILSVVGGFVAGVVFGYLFLRANPKKAEKVNTWVNENKP